jgi:hypothetical protein
VHDPLLDVHGVHRSSAVFDVPVNLPPAGPNNVFGMGETEGYEQQSRLVDVTVILVDADD